MLLFFVGCDQQALTPEYRSFNAANDLINSSKDGISYGETKEEKELAKRYSTTIKKLQKEFFTGGKKNRIISLTKEKFLTYCKINNDSILFLVHVPQFKRYKDEVRDTLNQLSWHVANEVTKDIKTDTQNLELAIGLRGSLAYGGSSKGIRHQEAKFENSFIIDENQFFKYFK